MALVRLENIGNFLRIGWHQFLQNVHYALICLYALICTALICSRFREIPRELLRQSRGGEVHVDMEDHRQEEYKAPKKTTKPFSGQGHKLGRYFWNTLLKTTPLKQVTRAHPFVFSFCFRAIAFQLIVLLQWVWWKSWKAVFA